MNEFNTLGWLQAPIGTTGWCAGKYKGKYFLSSIKVGTVSEVTSSASPNLILREGPGIYQPRKNNYGIAPGTKVKILFANPESSDGTIWCKVEVSVAPSIIPVGEERSEEEMAKKNFLEKAKPFMIAGGIGLILIGIFLMIRRK